MRRTITSLGLALILASGVPGVASADPPEETLQKLEQALESLADPAQVQAYTLTTVARHAKPNGKDAHDEKVVARIEVTGEGQTESEVLEQLHDGGMPHDVVEGVHHRCWTPATTAATVASSGPAASTTTNRSGSDRASRS